MSEHTLILSVFNQKNACISKRHRQGFHTPHLTLSKILVLPVSTCPRTQITGALSFSVFIFLLFSARRFYVKDTKIGKYKPKTTAHLLT